jgi:hypothetical protein
LPARMFGDDDSEHVAVFVVELGWLKVWAKSNGFDPQAH